MKIPETNDMDEATKEVNEIIGKPMKGLGLAWKKTEEFYDMIALIATISGMDINRILDDVIYYLKKARGERPDDEDDWR